MIRDMLHLKVRPFIYDWGHATPQGYASYMIGDMLHLKIRPLI